MKNILIYGIIAIVFFACSKPEKSIEKGVVDYAQKMGLTLIDYKPIETIVTDTVYTEELAKETIKDFEYRLLLSENSLDRTKKEIEEYSGDNISDLNRTLELQNKVVKSYKDNLSVVKALRNDVEFYVFEHRFQAKNGYGEFEEVKFNVLTDPEYNVLFVNNLGVMGTAGDYFFKKYNIKIFNPIN